MSETLTIRNFGPIKDMSFEFKKVNIFVGDQGTGKSTVAKLLSAIKEVSATSEKQLYINGNIADEEQKMLDFIKEFYKNLETFGIINYLKPDTYVEFNGSFDFLKYENEKISVKRISKEKKGKYTGVIGYIPAYREAIVLLKDDLNAILAVGTTLPKIFYFFGQSFSIAKKQKSFYNYADVLGVKYKYINSEDIIVLDSGEEIQISEASSAVNSGIPLLTVFDNAVESMYDTDHRMYVKLNSPYIIIEEPELNCFPTTQKKMMEHFISKIKYKISDSLGYYCNLIITTHSPYILTSLNNLMYAYRVGQEDPEEVSKIVEKKYWLNPDDVSVYKLNKGLCENIIDPELKQIKVEKIDEISEILSGQWHELASLNFDKQE